MLTRSQGRCVALSSVIFASLVLVSCGRDSSPTGPSGETSFLTGTWRGTLTISRTGQADVIGQTTWTFEIVPQSNRQSFRLGIQSDNSWLPVTATTTVVLSPTPEPPGRIGGSGNYASPRGCSGDFVTLADVQATTIDGSFAGVDCDQGAGRLGFDGRVRLTKQ